MADTPDIVEVLQKWASDYDDATWQQPSTLTRAADEIVRLRSLAQRLAGDLEDLHDTFPYLTQPCTSPTCTTRPLLAEARAALEAHDGE